VIQSLNSVMSVSRGSQAAVSTTPVAARGAALSQLQA
jgi:hypothetical protein